MFFTSSYLCIFCAAEPDRKSQKLTNQDESIAGSRKDLTNRTSGSYLSSHVPYVPPVDPRSKDCIGINPTAYGRVHHQPEVKPTPTLEAAYRQCHDISASGDRSTNSLSPVSDEISSLHFSSPTQSLAEKSRGLLPAAAASDSRLHPVGIDADDVGEYCRPPLQQQYPGYGGYAGTYYPGTAVDSLFHPSRHHSSSGGSLFPVHHGATGSTNADVFKPIASNGFGFGHHHHHHQLTSSPTSQGGGCVTSPPTGSGFAGSSSIFGAAAAGSAMPSCAYMRAAAVHGHHPHHVLPSYPSMMNLPPSGHFPGSV